MLDVVLNVHFQAGVRVPSRNWNELMARGLWSWSRRQCQGPYTITKKVMGTTGLGPPAAGEIESQFDLLQVGRQVGMGGVKKSR